MQKIVSCQTVVLTGLLPQITRVISRKYFLVAFSLIVCSQHMTHQSNSTEAISVIGDEKLNSTFGETNLVFGSETLNLGNNPFRTMCNFGKWLSLNFRLAFYYSFSSVVCYFSQVPCSTTICTLKSDALLISLGCKKCITHLF